MNRVLSTALEYLNYIIVLVIIASGGYAGWFFFQGDDPAAQNLGIASGLVLGLLAAALVGGSMALVVLIEKHLRNIRTHAVRQTELLEQLASMAEVDAVKAANQPDDGGFGTAPAWARTGPRY